MTHVPTSLKVTSLEKADATASIPPEGLSAKHLLEYMLQSSNLTFSFLTFMVSRTNTGYDKLGHT